MVTEEDLGHACEDVVTGFTGKMTGYVRYLSGCHQCLLVPSVRSDGTLPDSQWFDAQRLTVKEGSVRVVLDNSQTPGPDRQAPKR